MDRGELCALAETLDRADQLSQIRIRQPCPLAEHSDGIFDSVETCLNPVEAVQKWLEAEKAVVCFAQGLAAAHQNSTQTNSHSGTGGNNNSPENSGHIY